MLKGKAEIELTNVNTGEVEVYEEENMVTNAVYDILNDNVCGMLYYAYFEQDSSKGYDFFMPLYKNLINGVRLYQDPIPENKNDYYPPATNTLIGYSGEVVNSGTNTYYGSRNLNESKIIKNGYKYVWDFSTPQANGTISSICLTSRYFGKNENPLKRICYYANFTLPYENPYDNYSFKMFINKNYILVVSNDNKDVIIRKVPFYPFKNGIFTGGCQLNGNAENIEEQVFKNIYPAGICKYINMSDKEDYEEYGAYAGQDYYRRFSIDNEGTIYAITTDRIRNYKNNSTSSYSYSDTYENYLITIKDGVYTKEKLPFSSSTIYYGGRGSSENNNLIYFGCRGNYSYYSSSHGGYSSHYYDSIYTFNKTTKSIPSSSTYYINENYKNFTNGELINSVYTEGDKKINFKPFYNSESILTAERYKNYILVLGYYGSPNLYYFDLYLNTGYLATINNLSKPINKTSDQTMKITYTLTEE